MSNWINLVHLISIKINQFTIWKRLDHKLPFNVYVRIFIKNIFTVYAGMKAEGQIIREDGLVTPSCSLRIIARVTNFILVKQSGDLSSR